MEYFDSESNYCAAHRCSLVGWCVTWRFKKI